MLFVIALYCVASSFGDHGHGGYGGGGGGGGGGGHGKATSFQNYVLHSYHPVKVLIPEGHGGHGGGGGHGY